MSRLSSERQTLHVQQVTTEMDGAEVLPADIRAVDGFGLGLCAAAAVGGAEGHDLYGRHADGVGGFAVVFGGDFAGDLAGVNDCCVIVDEGGGGGGAEEEGGEGELHYGVA